MSQSRRDEAAGITVGLDEAKRRFVKELVQVAAVAVAAIQRIESGSTKLEKETDPLPWEEVILDRVRDERDRQEEKWGPQYHSPTFFMAILGEEFGEACTEALAVEIAYHQLHNWPTNAMGREMDI